MREVHDGPACTWPSRTPKPLASPPAPLSQLPMAAPLPTPRPAGSPTWKPPESVSMPRGQLMKLCSPPISATSSLPGGREGTGGGRPRMLVSAHDNLCSPGARLHTIVRQLRGWVALRQRTSAHMLGIQQCLLPTRPVLQMVCVSQDDLAAQLLQLSAGQPFDRPCIRPAECMLRVAAGQGAKAAAVAAALVAAAHLACPLA